MGLMLGLLIGGGFFILKLNDFFKELSFYKLSKHEENKADEKIVVKPGDNSKQYYFKSAGASKSASANNPADSTAQHEQSLKLSSDSTTIKDSLIQAAHEVPGVNPSNDIVVRKDEMRASKQVDLVNMTAVVSGNKDS